MANPTFNYRPLKGNEIRLIKIDETWLRPNRFSGNLEYVNLDDKPVYFALSYVWGDLLKTQTIVLNDQSFEVTVNLYDSLHQIRENAAFLQDMIQQELETPYSERRLWVDAVCINQLDGEEKKMQIPKMQAIYSSAYNVLIWLGTTEGTKLNPIGLAEFLQETHELSYINACFEVRTTHASAPSQEFLLLALFYAIYLIVELPWFERLWTVQEYLLGQRSPLALLGPGVFALHTIYELVEFRLQKIIQNTTGDLRDKLQTVFGILKGRTVRLRLLRQLRDNTRPKVFHTLTLTEQINYVLLRTFHKSSTLSHDQIYGLLGLVDQAKLPASLQVDYDKPFGEVCQQYVKYIIDETGNLNILFCMKHELIGYPSWVPDLRYRSPSTGPSGKPLTTNNISWSPDGQRLIVEGACLGYILAYSSNNPEKPDQETGDQSSCMFPDLHSQLRDFYDTILTASAWLRKQCLQDVWDEWLSPYEQLNGCEAEYPSMEDFLAAGLDDEEKVASTKFSHRMVMANVTHHFRSMHYGLMHDGQLLLCWPTVKYKARQYEVNNGRGQHVVWALKGTDLLSILSKDGQDYRLLGFCVPTRGLMLPIGNLDLDDEFFSNYETRRATLL